MQARVEQLPTSMPVDSDQPLPKSAPSVTSSEQHNQIDPKTLAARKAFWSQFKSKTPNNESVDDETKALLSKPTLMLGESIKSIEESQDGNVVLPAAGEPANPPQVPPVEVETTPPVLPEPLATAVVASEEMHAMTPDEAMRTRFSKMDDMELRTEFVRVKKHPDFPAYVKDEDIQKTLGHSPNPPNSIDELVFFHKWLLSRTPTQCVSPETETVPPDQTTASPEIKGETQEVGVTPAPPGQEETPPPQQEGGSHVA